MEVKYNSATGTFEVNFDVKNHQELFSELSAFQEIFEVPETFQLAGKTVSRKDIRYRVRTAEDKEGKSNEFYELVYQGADKDLWGYRKHFGCSQQKKGALFPKWGVKDEDKDKYENGGGGWFKWKTQRSQESVSSGTGPGF